LNRLVCQSEIAIPLLIVILNALLGVSLPAVGSGFTLVVLKMIKPFLKATAAIPNAFRFEDIKNSGEEFPFFFILNELLGEEESLLRG